MLIRIFVATALSLMPSLGFADMLPGADDPDYTAAVTIALGTDDRRAVQDLHALASAGNIAALTLLPTAEGWVPRTGSLKERAAFREIGGTPVRDLASAASPNAALWQHGAVSDDMTVQMERAVGLYALGQTHRGDTLLSLWLNQTGGFPPLSAGFADLPASVWIKALIIEARLTPFDFNPTPDPEGAMDILAAWLADDRIEGWLVLARAAGRTGGRILSPEAIADGKAIVAAALARTPPNLARMSDARIAAASLVWRATFDHLPHTPLSDADVQTILQELSPRPEMTPVTLYCNAQCPDDPASCQHAYIQAFGFNSGNFSSFEPQSDAITTQDFYASPRGEHELLSNAVYYSLRLAPDSGPDPAAVMAIPALAAAAKSDACFAAAVTRVLTTALPGGP